MRHHRIVVVLAAALSPMLALSSACSGEDKVKNGAPRSSDSGIWGKSNPAQNKKKEKEKEQEIRTEPEAVRVLQTLNETQVAEAEVGKTRTSSPTVRGLAESIATDHSSANARLEELIDSKGIAAQNNNMADRLKFNSSASLNHLRNVSSDMFDNAYTTRAVNSQKAFLANIDEDLAPVIVDEDLKADLAHLREQVVTHIAQAQQAADGVTTVAPGNRDAASPVPLEAGAAGGPARDAAGPNAGEEAIAPAQDGGAFGEPEAP